MTPVNLELNGNAVLSLSQKTVYLDPDMWKNNPSSVLSVPVCFGLPKKCFDFDHAAYRNHWFHSQTWKKPFFSKLWKLGNSDLAEKNA